MLDERFRLMYLSKDRADIKQYSLTWKRFVLFASLAGFCLSLVIAGGVALVFKVTSNARIYALETDKAYLQQQLLSMKESVAEINQQLAVLEASGDQFRDAAGLPRIDEDTRQLGVGGTAYVGSSEIGYYSEEIKKTADEINTDLDRFLRAIRYEKHSLANAATAVAKNKDKADHLPSIMPILGGYVDDVYGWRIHPVEGVRKFHHGIDIPGSKGTRILATADGKVTKIDYSTTWGNYVEVTHSNNLKTRYAHLSKCDVRVGQRVKRWDKIAEVGATGLVSGPHLHYEVEFDGNRVDPERYILTMK